VLTRKRILLAVLVLTAAGGALWYWWPFGRPADELRLQGIVEIQEVRLGSKIGGRVERLGYNPRTQQVIKEGDVVEKGQPLVYFEVPELKAQRAQWYARVQADRAASDRARNGPRQQEKDAGWAGFLGAEARLVRMNEGWREEEKRQAVNDLAATRADMNLAREDLDRVQQLYPKSASRAEYDAAQSTFRRAQARYEAARARNDMLQAGNRQEDIDEAAAAWWEAWNKYSLLQEGTREEDKREAQAKLEESEAKLREIDTNLEESVVRAPDRAVIEVLGVRPGDLVPANQPILRILKADDLWVKVYVPETELGKVRLNQKVQVTIDSYPGRRFSGTIIQIAAISEFTPRNVQSADERRHQVFGVKVRVDNTEGIFKSGMAAEVTIPLKE
jgi:multidrug resistance efflux pump